MIRTLALLLLPLLLLGCETTVADAGPEPEPVQGTLSASDRRACLSGGGEVRRAGMAGWESCITPYSDGGTVCTDSSQCEGECRGDVGGAENGTVTGLCQPDDNPFGCYSLVENGAVTRALCVD